MTIVGGIMLAWVVPLALSRGCHYLFLSVGVRKWQSETSILGNEVVARLREVRERTGRFPDSLEGLVEDLPAPRSFDGRHEQPWLYDNMRHAVYLYTHGKLGFTGADVLVFFLYLDGQRPQKDFREAGGWYYIVCGSGGFLRDLRSFPREKQ